MAIGFPLLLIGQLIFTVLAARYWGIPNNVATWNSGRSQAAIAAPRVRNKVMMMRAEPIACFRRLAGATSHCLAA